ncbi:hypothetical protein HER10_EVM0003453 [Colletotrichum scovillei]|uniref:C6 zinc finger domain-containing protein n=1 Tax=Colletotrichum scovillei TaxID=1209932 RepID=A0A9P7UBB5_9PEZI|nr:uncharacterized protein HER10_EVM0003453 [Colletotrichum scovillei]KAF4773699.1 hypothetical protein HER10_EVM0003453 [Colletotrichum scovillei]KAG7048353.1 C6 zinc finger domain-containing protein [Colletotrichum scovillei]KAG7065517.1 C6 zinc finger domain-containing protein [Colletotrichum scovillei]KAG7068120.1 C6 zinc finger domain-containing protein [Colletotrichum scovillei]
MQAISSDCDTSSTSFGQRRGISDLARFALDLTWATPTRAESETPARPRAYPSPPMSGSPPLPPKPNPEAGDRGQLHGSYPSTSPQNAYRGGLPPTTIPQGDYRGPPPPPHSLPPPQPRSYHADPQDRMPYSYPRPDDHLRTTPSGYAHLASQVMQQRPPPPYMQMSGPPPPQPTGPHQHGYATTMSQTSQDSGPYTSPKTQRKTKGHVASACVPCKRAHLRCDAQRPCSRCTSNGKEDACVDVQHKKRGRPRLRDDREARYGPSTYQHPQDAAAAAAAAARRPPLSHYSAGTPISGYDDPIRGSHSYRVLKSQPSEPIAPRYLDRAPMADANLYGQPPSLASGAPEPVIFLTTELEIARASPAFADAVGIPNVRGRSLFDIVVPTEREKLQSHQRQIQEERTRKDPVYLPPIFGRQEQERVFDSLRFEADEISRFQLDRQDFFVFAASDGQPRSYSVRLGLAKRESIYFIVLLINAAPRYPYPSPSPHAREVPYPYPPQQQAYAQHTPVSATFEQPRPRFGEGALAPRPSPGQPLHMASGLSPGISPGMPSYAASPSRPEYASGPSSYQIPRSELPPTTRPPQPSFQLPPIRAGPHQPPQPESSSWQRDERSGRVDIGGLLEKPDPQQRRPQ